MTKKSYSEKLKDPRWQKKRLQIFKRDGFSCRMCGDTENTLHVHHTYYESGNDSWDYPPESLKTLCCHCHQLAEDMKDYQIPFCGFLAFNKRVFPDGKVIFTCVYIVDGEYTALFVSLICGEFDYMATIAEPVLMNTLSLVKKAKRINQPPIN